MVTAAEEETQENHLEEHHKPTQGLNPNNQFSPL
jgi:hypothetical protein